MTDVRELWSSIQDLSSDDRNWLCSRLSDWVPLQRFRAHRRESAENEGRFTIIFDGGSRGNPGPGYGSYTLLIDNQPSQLTRLDFEDDMTNNEAEYETLIRALEDLQGQLAVIGRDPRGVDVLVLGDSQLVISQVTGVWKARDPRMLQRRNRVRVLVQTYSHVSFKKRAREEIVEVLGH